MKFSILITTALFPLFTLAGGGGGLRPTMKAFSQNMNTTSPSSAEAVFLIGQKDETVRFAYGNWNGNSWKVKVFDLPNSDVQDSKLQKAFSDSSQNNTWIRID